MDAGDSAVWNDKLDTLADSLVDFLVDFLVESAVQKFPSETQKVIDLQLSKSATVFIFSSPNENHWVSYSVVISLDIQSCF